MSKKDLASRREQLARGVEVEQTAELLSLAGNSTRLKLLYLMDVMQEVCVVDLSEMVGVSVSAVSQHLSKLRAYGLIKSRRDAQTIYYSLTGHDFNEKLRSRFFAAFRSPTQPPEPPWPKPKPQPKPQPRPKPEPEESSG